MKNLPLSLVLVTLLSACSSSVHLYDGPERQARELSKVSMTRSDDVVIEVVRIDDKKISDQSVYLLPGKHTVKVTFKDWYKNKYLSNQYPFMARVERATCVAKLNSQPGDAYLIALNENGGVFTNGQAQPKIAIVKEGLHPTKSKGSCEVRDPALPIE